MHGRPQKFSLEGGGEASPKKRPPWSKKVPIGKKRPLHNEKNVAKCPQMEKK